MAASPHCTKCRPLTHQWADPKGWRPRTLGGKTHAARHPTPARTAHWGVPRASFQAKTVFALGRGRSRLSCSYIVMYDSPSSFSPQGLTNSEATQWGWAERCPAGVQCGVAGEGELGGPRRPEVTSSAIVGTPLDLLGPRVFIFLKKEIIGAPGWLCRLNIRLQLRS